jgi:putative transposase
LTVRAALAAAGYPKSSWYRHQQPGGGGVVVPIRQADRVQPSALTAVEEAQIVGYLGEERFADLSVQQVYYRVFDEGCYVASMRTWYRVAARRGLSGDRRAQASHPPKTVPELVAYGPNEVWSWDITRIKIATQKTALHLYLIEDVFSRKCVGWRLEHREKDELAVDLIINAVSAERAKPDTLHADGGASMTSEQVKQLLAGLGIDHSRSRPHVSNDNPFSESLFKTVKYDLDYPGVFTDETQARDWLTRLLRRYNAEHCHSGLHGYTPNDVHDGTWTDTAASRQAVLDNHSRHHPRRYRHPPKVRIPPGTVWINKPAELSQAA